MLVLAISILNFVHAYDLPSLPFGERPIVSADQRTFQQTEASRAGQDQ